MSPPTGAAWNDTDEMTLIYLRSTDDDIFLGGGFHAVAINDASKL